MTVSRSRVEFSRALMRPLMSVPTLELNDILAELEVQCREEMRAEEVPDEVIEIQYAYYAMYQGQGQDNRLELPGRTLDDSTMADVSEAFHDFYDRRFGYRAPEIPIYCTALSVVAVGPHPAVKLPDLPTRASVGGSKRGCGSAAGGFLRLDGQLHAKAPIYARPSLMASDHDPGAGSDR